MITKMEVDVVSHPPLDSVTSVPAGSQTIPFSVLLRVGDGPARLSRVEIYHNIGLPAWEGLPLTPDDADPLVLSSPAPQRWCRYSGSLPIGPAQSAQQDAAFTVRYSLEPRPGQPGQPGPGLGPPGLGPDWDELEPADDSCFWPESRSPPLLPLPDEPAMTGLPAPVQPPDWIWANMRYKTGDGRLIFASPLPEKGDEPLARYIADTAADVLVDTITPPVSYPARLWKLSVPMKPASAVNPHVISGISLGTVQRPSRSFALTRLNSFWIRPLQGKPDIIADRNALLLCFERTDGQHVAILALSGACGTYSALSAVPGGEITLSARNFEVHDGAAVVLLAVADSFQRAIATVSYSAKRLAFSLGWPGHKHAAVLDGPADGSLSPAVFGPNVPEIEHLSWADNLTYCTWNSLGPAVTQQGILDALRGLRESGIQVSHLVIDDGWQDVTDGKLTSFEAGKHAFPHGLEAGIKEIRRENPGLYDVSMWHTIIGYWSGLDQAGPALSSYSTTAVIKDGKPIQVFDAADVGRAFDDFYHFLSSCQVTGVKCDYQGFLDTISPSSERRSLVRPYQYKWLAALQRHFKTQGIACMGMTPALMFDLHSSAGHRPLPMRTSDDYFPDIPDSHGWHIWTNAHNGTLVGLLNIVPDWDMFQTHHAWAGPHAAARCISGGPVTITDLPGRHCAGLAGQIAASNRAGRTIALRPHGPGMATDVYHSIDDARLLKVRNYVVGPSTLVRLLALFNVSRCKPARPIAEVVRLGHLLGDCNPSGIHGWIVRSHRSGRVTGPLANATANTAQSEMVVSVEPGGWDVLSAYALYDCGDGVSVAPLGLTDKISGAAALTGTTYTGSLAHGSTGTVAVSSRLRGGVFGRFGIWISDLADSAGADPARRWQSRLLVDIDGQPVGPEYVTVGRADPAVLEIDVARFVQQDLFVPSERDRCTVTVRISSPS